MQKIDSEKDSKQYVDIITMKNLIDDRENTHSMGSIIAMRLIDSISEDNWIKKKEKEAKQKQLYNQIRTGTLWDYMGIVVGNEKDGSIWFGPYWQQQEQKLHFSIVEPNKTLTWFKQLDSKDIDNNTIPLLTKIINSLVRRIHNTYTITNSEIDDDFLHLMMISKDIIDVCDNLGIPCTWLKQTYHYAKQQCLIEYISFYNNWLHPSKPSGRLAPHKIWFDTSPDYFYDKRLAAIEVFKSSSSNPHAHNMVHDTATYRTKELTIIKDNTTRPDYLKPNQIQLFKDIASNNIENLQQWVK